MSLFYYRTERNSPGQKVMYMYNNNNSNAPKTNRYMVHVMFEM